MVRMTCWTAMHSACPVQGSASYRNSSRHVSCCPGFTAFLGWTGPGSFTKSWQEVQPQGNWPPTHSPSSHFQGDCLYLGKTRQQKEDLVVGCPIVGTTNPPTHILKRGFHLLWGLHWPSMTLTLWILSSFEARQVCCSASPPTAPWLCQLAEAGSVIHLPHVSNYGKLIPKDRLMNLLIKVWHAHFFTVGMPMTVCQLPWTWGNRFSSIAPFSTTVS